MSNNYDDYGYEDKDYDDGSVAYPVHQVLLYKWTDSRNAPTIDTTSSTKPEGWQESPGNGTPNTYLWM